MFVVGGYPLTPMGTSPQTPAGSFRPQTSFCFALSYPIYKGSYPKTPTATLCRRFACSVEQPEQEDRCHFVPAPYGGRMLSIHFFSTFAKVSTFFETTK